MAPLILSVAVPEYTLDVEPDYLGIGRKVDGEMLCGLSDGRYVCRALGKEDHPQLSLEELVAVILRLGTDRYDPDRKGVAWEEFQAYDFDLQAAPLVVEGGRIVLDDTYEYPTYFGEFVHDFYVKTLYDRGYRVRLDVLTIYHADRLLPAAKTDPNAPGVAPHLEAYLYRFGDRANKSAALAGIVQVLR